LGKKFSLKVFFWSREPQYFGGLAEADNIRNPSTFFFLQELLCLRLLQTELSTFFKKSKLVLISSIFALAKISFAKQKKGKYEASIGSWEVARREKRPLD